MKDLNKNIGENLKRIRKSRKLTIDELSLDAVVSKSMISEIERGIRNPSITVLWNLANSLKVSLNYFLKDGEEYSPTIYKKGEHVPICGEAYTFHPLMNFDEEKKFEIYLTEYNPHSQTDTSRHFDGVEEYVLIISGTLIAHIDDKSLEVNQGEVLHFIADKLHYYSNPTDQTAKAFILMFYPQ